MFATLLTITDPTITISAQIIRQVTGVTKKRKRKTENGRLFGGNMTRKRLLGIPKKVEELPDFGLFGGNFQNRRKSLKRTRN